MAVQYLEGKCRDALDKACATFEDFRSAIWQHQSVILNEFGSGAYLEETNAILSHLNVIIELSQDLVELVICEGWDGFMDKYQLGYLRYQRTFA